MRILLTNDDGIDAPGLRTLYDRLSSIADVTVVAPADDQSAVGRQLSRSVELRDHEMGYAVGGTPADCVVAGLDSLEIDPDLVVAGCNQGANLGAYVLGRSGTVSAAVEATFFGVPAIAASVYFPGDEFAFDRITPGPEHYRECARAVEYLAERALDAGIFETADYLNVNAPLPSEGDPASMEITHPSHVYQIEAERDGDTVEINDAIWARMADGTVPDPEGSDRRVVLDGDVSVSPLTAQHALGDEDALYELSASY